MTEEEILKLYDELKEFYGDKLVNFEHYPRVFVNQIKIYKYYKGQ